MASDFKWPQVWTTDLAIDQQLPGGRCSARSRLIYSQGPQHVFMRNADLVAPVRTLPDGRPYYGGFGANELNPDGGAGIYVIDNTDRGLLLQHHRPAAQDPSTSTLLALGYSFTEAKNSLKSTEIASVLWQNQPVQGDPNKPELSFSEFGQRHRIVGGVTVLEVVVAAASARRSACSLEVAEGNRFGGAGGNRYSFIYSGDVNGDGRAETISSTSREPRRDHLRPAPCSTAASRGGAVDGLDAFIEQDAT